MDRKALKIAILGAGRLGGALHKALSRSGFSSSLSSRPKSPQAVRNTREALSAADIAFLCVPDAQIAATAAQYADAFHAGQTVAHCAGALTLEVLASAAAHGAAIGSMHPLCAIASPETSFVGIHAAIAGADAPRELLRQLARAIGLTPFEVGDVDRARYHAAAALAANGLMALAAQTSALFASCGIDPRQALGAILPLMRSAVVALDQKGLPGALTGPSARGDVEVVEGHLAALRRPGDEALRATYIDLSRTLTRLSAQLGAATPEAIRAIDAALAAPAPASAVPLPIATPADAGAAPSAREAS